MKIKALFVLLPMLAMLPSVTEAQSLTRGPYLQNGSTTDTTVRWRTSIATDSVVRYGTAAGSLTLTASNATSTTEHEIRLTGLTANTKYYYSIGYGSTTLASGTDYFVVTAPTGAKPTRIWVLGDPGTGSTVQTAVRDAYYAFTGTTHTDLWLMLGDNAYSSGTDAEYTARLYGIYPTMARKSVLWTTIGNHDAGSADSPTQTGPYYNNATLPKQGEAGGVASGTEAYYSFDYGNIHFVCLDSMDTSRSATGPMAVWLTNDLQNNTKDWLVVFFHHPPYSKGSHNSDSEIELVEMRQNFGPILENYGADLVLCGHSHSYERSKFIDGHYGVSTTFSNAMVVQSGGGQGAGAYTKSSVGPLSHSGTVYAVPGASGQISGGTLNHPAMFVSLNVAGSMVLDVNGSSLNATYLDSAGVVRDSFAITKGGSGGNVLPTVAISSPASGATFTAPASITINATATDSDGTITQVDFYQGATLLGSATSSPYSFTWTGVAAGSYSLTAKATDNAGGTQTSTAIPVTVNAAGGATKASFQEGNNYSGMVDAHIRSDATATNFGYATTLLVDGKPDYSALLKWDLTTIPVGKTVTAVTLTFNVVAASSQVYELYALKRNWSESEVTWLKANNTTPWTAAGASSTTATGDRESTVLGTVSSSTTGSKTITLNAAGVAKVQSWVNTPASNFGFILQDYTTTKGLELTSKDGLNVAQRPIITITYQ
ncbi:MAG: DNRLRE domain-containing protein [Opitutus sp.]